MDTEDVDKIVRALKGTWPDLTKGDTIPDALSEVANALNRIADAINGLEKGD